MFPGKPPKVKGNLTITESFIYADFQCECTSNDLNRTRLMTSEQANNMTHA